MAFFALTGAVALGLGLALNRLRGEGPRRPALALLHGAFGLTGLGLLLAVLQGPRRGVAMGVGSFGMAAAVLFGIALLAGPAVPLLFRRAPGLSGLALAVHAICGISGFTLFLAWISF